METMRKFENLSKYTDCEQAISILPRALKGKDRNGNTMGNVNSVVLAKSSSLFIKTSPRAELFFCYTKHFENILIVWPYVSQ